MKKLKYLFYFIAIILSFFAFTCFKQVNAKTYYTTGYGNNSVIYTYPASSTNIQLGNEYTTTKTITYMDLQLVANQDDPFYPNSLTGLNNGTYLYDFYIVSPSGLFGGLGNCYNFTTDFAFYDSNSGSIISGSDRIKSQCVDTHYTYINGVAAYHVLTQFTLAEVGETDPQRFRFRMANYVNGFVGPNSKYRIISGNIQDYDSSIVSDFTNQTQIHLQTEQNQTIINQNTQIKDSITSSTVDDPSGTFNQFESYLPENGVITQLITLPISLFQKVLSSINGTCSQYNLGNLMGTDLILPCINISNYIGITLWNVIDVLFSGLFVLVIAKKMIKAFNSFSSMEEGDVID